MLDLLAVAKIAGKHALKNGIGMLNGGKKVPGWKLAKARANRVFKDVAAKAADKTFGALAMTVPALKSPAKIDELPGGKAFTARYAFKPDKGNTMVPETDSRAAINRDTKSNFSPVAKGAKT